LDVPDPLSELDGITSDEGGGEGGGSIGSIGAGAGCSIGAGAGFGAALFFGFAFFFAIRFALFFAPFMALRFLAKQSHRPNVEVTKVIKLVRSLHLRIQVRVNERARLL
jgi:hypothetical protein